MSPKIRARIAPSPTGYPHIGTVYQAMFDFVFSKGLGGHFIVRIEDTDRARFVEGAEEVIFKSLDWFGLQEDESPRKNGAFGPYRSSERLDIYKKYVQQLIRERNAYRCFCTKERLEEMRKKQQQEKKTPRYDRTCLKLTQEEINEKIQKGEVFVVRMKIPDDRVITVEDAVLGKVEFRSNEIDDQVILKSDGFPTYHLAVVVDDYLMKVTHVFRGQEWMPSTPKHILLYEFLGWKKNIPQFVHLPVILNMEGGGKLSKRQGHASVDYYRERGFLPDAILNYLANIAWNHPDGKEIFDFHELIKAFKVDKETGKIEHVEIYSQGPKFDLKKLEWMNGEYIRMLSNENLLVELNTFDPQTLDAIPADIDKLRLIEIVKTRIKTLKEFKDLISPFFKKHNVDLDKTQKELRNELFTLLSSITEWDKQHVTDTILNNFIFNKKVKYPEIYKVVLGTERGLPLNDTFAVIGKDRTLALLN